MKRLLLLIVAQMLVVTAVHAERWDVASVSVIVTQSGTPQITQQVFSARSYLTATATLNNQPIGDLFVGVRESNGQLAVVNFKTKTVLFTIVSAPTLAGASVNGLNTKQVIAATASIASPSSVFSGFVYDTVVFKTDNTRNFKSFSRTMLGGTQTQTIKGTVKIGSKHFDL